MGTRRQQRLLRVSAVVAIGIAALVPLGAQNPAPSEQSTFRAGVDIVRVDVSVLEKDRTPVRGLTAADFEVLEDGRPRPVVAFSAIEVPGPMPAAASAAAWVREVAADVAENQSHDVRRIAIVMDDAMTFPDPRVSATAKAIARHIVDRLGPGDQAAIVFTYFPAAAQSFTADRAKLLAAIDRFLPRYKVTVRRPVGIDFDDAATYASARTLSNIADYLIGVPDRRKAIAFISPGAAVNSSALSPRGDEDLAILEMQQVLERTARANVTLFGFDPTGIEGAASYVAEQLVSAGLGSEAAFALARRQAALEQQFLQSTAEHTGGQAVRNTNDFAPALSSMFEQLSTYYLIGFQPADPKKDGALRRLEIKMRRPGLTVHARDGYYATKSTAAPASASSSGAAALDRAVRATDTSADVSLHATTAVFAGPDRKNARAAIVVGVDLPREPNSTRLTEKADLLVRAFDAEGRARATRALSVDVALRPTSVRRTYYEILAGLDLAPGRYELRLGLRSAMQDRIGSVFQQIDVPDFANTPLSLSSVVFSTVPALHSAPPNAFVSWLPVVPTASREFPRSIAVRAFARVCLGVGAPAANVTVRATITSATGDVVLDQPQIIAAGRFLANGAVDVNVDVPVGGLRGGDYLLSVQANAGPAGARHDVRFTVIE